MSLASHWQPGAGGAPEEVLIAPYARNHKESLAIYMRFTDYKFMKITRLLNHKYKDTLPPGHRFGQRLVEKTWDQMVETADRAYTKVKGWKRDYWRVRRVLEWAEEDDLKNPL